MLSSSFVTKVTQRLDRLDKEALKEFVLRLSEERDFFRIIFDSMAEGVVITDEKHVVQYANRAAEVLLAKKCEQMRSNAVLDCIESVDFYNLIKSAIFENERVRNKEVSLYLPADRILNVNVFPLYKGGESYGNVIIFMDITREKEEQQKLRRAESMAALSSITAGIAHEIKNPLGAMDIHLQLMEQVLDELPDSQKADFSRYLVTVREEVARLNDIVVDFLSAIRPLKLHLTFVSLNDVVEELAEFVRLDLENSGITFRLELDRKLPQIKLDKKLFRQVLLNLVKNGQEALPHGGVILIRSRLDGDSVLVVVEDDGSGIEAERINSIFEPYNTTKPSGTGLGLTIVYRIVKEHGGDIKVDSQLDKGSRFMIRLPLKERAAPMLGYS